MRIMHAMLIGASISLAGTTLRPAATTRGTYAAPQAAAMVRFSNQIPSSRMVTLSVNGSDIFRDVAPNTTTGYTTVPDSSLTFAIRRSDSDTTEARTIARLMDAHRYTLIATAEPDSKAVLTVQEDPLSGIPIPSRPKDR